MHKVKKQQVAFTERSSVLNKSPFTEDLSPLDSHIEKSIALSPKDKNNTMQSVSKQSMKEKQKSLHNLMTSKNMTSSQIEYT